VRLVGALRVLARHRPSLIGLIVLSALVLASIVGPLVSPYSPNQVDLRHAFEPPSGAHLLGTDEVGRDILTRLLYGGRLSLLIGGVSALVAIGVGTIIGITSGFYGGWLDQIAMRVVDGLLAIPAIFLLLLIIVIIGASELNIVLALGLTRWMGIARLVRGEVLRTRNLLYVDAARATGAGQTRLLVHHLLPQAIPSLTVATTLGVGAAILAESALSYLGLGVQPPNATWGNMLSNSQSYIYQAAPIALYPGLLILVTVLSINTFGDGLRDALDPHRIQRQRTTR